MFASKNRERRYDQGRKEFVSHYPQVLEQPWMQQINFFCKRFTGVENMTSDNVV